MLLDGDAVNTEHFAVKSSRKAVDLLRDLTGLTDDLSVISGLVLGLVDARLLKSLLHLGLGGAEIEGCLSDGLSSLIIFYNGGHVEVEGCVILRSVAN